MNRPAPSGSACGGPPAELDPVPEAGDVGIQPVEGTPVDQTEEHPAGGDAEVLLRLVALTLVDLTEVQSEVATARPGDTDADLADLKRRHALRVASFGHAGDGNIHVNLMVNKDDPQERGRATQAERELFERVVSLEGSISGEHGIGFAKARYLPIELSPEEIALMKRVKTAFDPNGILNPGKIFP